MRQEKKEKERKRGKRERNLARKFRSGLVFRIADEVSDEKKKYK